MNVDNIFKSLKIEGSSDHFLIEILKYLNFIWTIFEKRFKFKFCQDSSISWKFANYFFLKVYKIMNFHTNLRKFKFEIKTFITSNFDLQVCQLNIGEIRYVGVTPCKST